MKRVKVKLLDRNDISDNELDDVLNFIFKNNDLNYLNLFNEKYMVEIGITTKDKTFVLVDIIDDIVYVEGYKPSDVIAMVEKAMNENTTLNERKAYVTVICLTLSMIQEKVIRTSDREIKINLNYRPCKNTNKYVEIKNYKYEKKEYQGRPYHKSDKTWKVRGHFRNVKGTLHWIASYDKQFI